MRHAVPSAQARPSVSTSQAVEVPPKGRIDLTKDLSCSEQTVLTPHRYGGSDVSQGPSEQASPADATVREAAEQLLPRAARSQAVQACEYAHDPLFAAAVNHMHRGCL
ncbi:hypothetical protein WJX77_007808 [Trebouxia sp. C0004]